MVKENPKARREGLLIEELPTELLVYDQKRHQAHCLNASAASVFRVADGTLSVAGIARAAGERLQTPVDEDLVWTALQELDKHDLLDTALPLVPPQGPTRRSVLAGAAALLPLVVAISAPTPAYAQSANGTGAPIGSSTAFGF